MVKTEKSQVAIITQEIGKQLATKEVAGALLQTTFKGFSELNMRKAIFEGMMRGFSFKDFLEKNVYAIPYGQTYSLVNSIDYTRKIAMRSGLAGKSEPIFEEDENGAPKSCKITVKRHADGTTGEYTAKVYFKEYSTGRNLWVTKPHTMIAKVAEMHALRSAFPEEMAQVYVEEEFEKETETLPTEEKVGEYSEKLKATKTLQELRSVYASLPQSAKAELRQLADELKKQYENLEI